MQPVGCTPPSRCVIVLYMALPCMLLGVLVTRALVSASLSPELRPVLVARVVHLR